jgi:hypothetical protein
VEVETIQELLALKESIHSTAETQSSKAMYDEKVGRGLG